MEVGGGNGPSVFLTRYALGSSTSPGTLQIHLGSGKITLAWSAGALQQADTPMGTFHDVAGATSPYTIPAVGLAQFYRLR